VSVAVVRDMDAYGVCVVDDFLGPEMGQSVRDEVVGMYNQGLFKDGQTVNSTGDVKSIRRDKITWLDGRESQCRYIGALIAKVDTVIQQANKVHFDDVLFSSYFYRFQIVKLSFNDLKSKRCNSL